MKAYYTILLISTLLLSQCTLYNEISYYDEESSSRDLTIEPTNREPGKCYAKCLISDLYEEESIEYIVYTGKVEEEENEVEIEEVTVVITPARTKWEKRKADRDCLSADPNDCLVWTLIEVPEETIQYTTLLDTTQSKNFEIRDYNKRSLQRKGGFTEWREVLCNYQVTSELIHHIQDELRNRGYDPGPSDKVMGTKTKAALTQFQKDHNLPVGQMDMESMATLGIRIR